MRNQIHELLPELNTLPSCQIWQARSLKGQASKALPKCFATSTSIFKLNQLYRLKISTFMNLKATNASKFSAHKRTLWLKSALALLWPRDDLNAEYQPTNQGSSKISPLPQWEFFCLSIWLFQKPKPVRPIHTADRVAKCQIFYTEENPQTKF